MGGLFSPGKAQTSSSTQVNLPGWSSSGLGSVGERVPALMSQPYQPFTGQRVAGMSDWTQQAAGTAQEVSGYQPGQVAPGSVSAERVQPRSLAGTDLQPYFDPFQQQVIDASMADIDRSTRVAQAGRTAGGIQAAGFGGFGDRASVAGAEIERAGIDAKARTVAGLRSAGFGRAQDMAVGDISRDMAAQEGNAGRSLQAGVTNLQAGQRAQEFNTSAGLQGAAQRLQGSQQLATLGELERAIRQGGLDFDYQQFREGRDDPYLKTQWGAGVLQGASAPFQGNTSSTGTTPGPSAFGQIAGAATGLIGAVGLLSDPGEKTDRKRLGTDPETGLGIWSFRYKGDPKRYPKVIGYMADEVEEEFPDRVRRVAGRRVIDMPQPGMAGGGRAYADGGLADPLAPFRRRDRRAIDERWDRNPAPPMPPIIEGVAEAVPMTEAWQPTPPVPNAPPRAVSLPGGGALPDEAYDGGHYPFAGGAGGGPTFPGEEPTFMPHAPGAEDESRFGQAGPVAAALRRIAATRARAGGTGRDDERRFGAAGPAPAPRDAGPDAMAADGPLVPVSAVGGGGGGGAPAAAPEEGFFRRLSRRLTDPEYAGPLALMHAGAAMMASRHPYALGAIGEGLSRGVQTARDLMPEARQQRESGQLAELVQGVGLPADAVSPRIAPRPAAPGGGPTRMTSVAVPGGSLRDRVGQAESGGNPNARNPAPGSTAGGVLQITDAMWADYAPRLRLPASARMDPDAQGAVFDAFEADMRRTLPGVLGRDATDADVYAAWGLGPAGFRALATAAPGADAFEVYSQVAGPERAAQAFSQNGRLMQRGMTASQVVEAWGRRVSGGGGGAPAGGDDRRPAARPAAEAEPEPTVDILGRRLNRTQVLSIMAAAPNNPAVQRVMGNALQVLNGDIARQDAQRDRRDARQESAELRREIAGRERAPQPTTLARLIEERDRLPANDPRRAAYDAAIRRETGEGRTEGWTAVQIAQSRQQATSQARQEAQQLDFSSEADRSGWINQRGRELLAEWGVPDRPEGAGGSGVLAPLSGGAGGGAAPRPSGAPEDAAADSGARVRPRQAPPAGYRWTGDGLLEWIPGGPADPSRQGLTEAQSRANLFGTFMQQSLRILEGEKLPNGEWAQRPVEVPSAATIALWRNTPDGLSNLVMSDSAQRYFNALRLFAAGILRRETGAAFTTNELMDVQSRFFPMAGDSAATQRQKAENRRLALGAMRAELPGGSLRGSPAPGRAPQADGAQPRAAPAPAQGNPLERFLPQGAQ
jgi:hypothetical protein